VVGRRRKVALHPLFLPMPQVDERRYNVAKSGCEPGGRPAALF
jgi:hypothetical protein